MKPTLTGGLLSIALGVVVLAVVTVLMACGGGPRYEEGSPPDESWKIRGQYCYFVDVDPHGEDNSVYFWSDDVELTSVSGFATVKATNVRASISIDNDRPGDPEDDYFVRGKTEVVEDGGVSIEGRCYE